MLSSINVNWIAEYFLICLGGVFFVIGGYNISKSIVEKKFEHYGYQLHMKTISLSKARLNVYMAVLPAGFALCGLAAIIFKPYFWDVGILGVLLCLPSMIIGANKYLDKLEKEASAKNG